MRTKFVVVIAAAVPSTFAQTPPRAGSVVAWGANSSGQAGPGTTGEGATVPQPQRVNLDNMVAVAGGGEQSYALDAHGTVWGWGANDHGQIGMRTAGAEPMQIATGMTAIAAGAFHALALKDDGTVWAWGGNAAGEIGEFLLVPSAQRQGDESGACRQHAMAELARELVCESGRTHARYRKAAGRDDERRGGERSRVRGDVKQRFVAPHPGDRATGQDPHTGGSAFIEQHAHDLFRRVVAEQLAELLLVPGDAVALDEFDEIIRRVARQRGLAEVRIRRQEIRWRRSGIREIAAAAAGHQDFLADAIRMLDHEHAAAAPARCDRAHQAGRAGADYDRVPGFRHAPFPPPCGGAIRTVQSTVADAVSPSICA